MTWTRKELHRLIAALGEGDTLILDDVQVTRRGNRWWTQQRGAGCQFSRSIEQAAKKTLTLLRQLAESH